METLAEFAKNCKKFDLIFICINLLKMFESCLRQFNYLQQNLRSFKSISKGKQLATASCNSLVKLANNTIVDLILCNFGVAVVSSI